MSLHFLFRSEDHLKKGLADPRVVQAVKDMVEEHGLRRPCAGALSRWDLRDMYSKKEVHRVEDMKGLEVRVQATATEDPMFPIWSANLMPFGNVYTRCKPAWSTSRKTA